jgi:2-C-methyl-D-erythritol 4-phosphate cytidylyltransferase/2-C-methyl-D-erythritol 2,4-cyclodiphosphate synthase
MTRIGVIIVAGGGGSRLGGKSKQYRMLSGVAVMRRAILPFLRLPQVVVQPVIRAGDEAHAATALQGLPVLAPVLGGATRQESVRAGLQALAAHKPEFVLVHDAARPFVSLRLIGRVVEALEEGAKAVLPTVPVAETLKFSRSSVVEATQSREHLHGAQTPQGFAYAVLCELHEKAANAEHTDDAALAEAAGIAVEMVPGERRNLKITTQDDWEMAEELCHAEEETRVGQGFDVHRLLPHGEDVQAARRVIHIGGVAIPHSHYLEGHSDADVGLHALVDALLGALGEGDIGTHFPPSEPQWRGADSARFMLHALHLLRSRGGRLLHADLTLICEAPKIGPHREAIRARIAELWDTPQHRISIKATTTEKLGFTGRGEGMAAQAMVTIAVPPYEE